MEHRPGVHMERERPALRAGQPYPELQLAQPRLHQFDDLVLQFQQ